MLTEATAEAKATIAAKKPKKGEDLSDHSLAIALAAYQLNPEGTNYQYPYFLKSNQFIRKFFAEQLEPYKSNRLESEIEKLRQRVYSTEAALEKWLPRLPSMDQTHLPPNLSQLQRMINSEPYFACQEPVVLIKAFRRELSFDELKQQAFWNTIDYSQFPFTDPVFTNNPQIKEVRGEFIGLSMDVIIGQMSEANPLNHQQIMICFQILEGAKKAVGYLERYTDWPKEVRERLEGLVSQQKAVRDLVVFRNSKLVMAIAKRYIKRGLPLEDLFNEGNLGLMRAIEKFDPRLGFQFSTYAFGWVGQAITRALADQGRMIRLPVHMVETINRFNRAQSKLMQDLGREPSPEEMARHLGASVERVKTMQRAANLSVTSFNHSAKDGEMEPDPSPELVDGSEDVEGEVIDRIGSRQVIGELLEGLTIKERDVIERRFGLNGYYQMSLEEIGKVFGVTREAVRQWELNALRRLKSQARSSKLRADEWLSSH